MKPAEPRSLADLIRITTGLPAADFCRAYTSPFLLASGLLSVRIDPTEMQNESTAVVEIHQGAAHAPGSPNPLAGQVHVLRRREAEPRGPIVVGRADECDIVISDPSVSGSHATFECDGETVWVSDSGSRNGTFVNQLRIPPTDRIPLEDEDVVTFGRASFQLFRPLALFVALQELRGAP